MRNMVITSNHGGIGLICRLSKCARHAPCDGISITRRGGKVKVQEFGLAWRKYKTLQRPK